MINTDEPSLTCQVTQARNELNNLRKKIQGLKAQHKKDISKLESLLTSTSSKSLNVSKVQRNPHNLPDESFNKESICHDWTPIGYISSWFQNKNGTPRQGSVSSLTRGKLRLEKCIFNNPQHALQGLNQYSHIWIFFVFDQNTCSGKGFRKSKVSPPRLNGERVGVFSTRSPHRPNPLGLTLACLEKVEDDCLYLSGIDILDGTPVLDIKPYILQYDAPSSVVKYIDATTNMTNNNDLNNKEPIISNSSLPLLKNAASSKKVDHNHSFLNDVEDSISSHCHNDNLIERLDEETNKNLSHFSEDCKSFSLRNDYVIASALHEGESALQSDKQLKTMRTSTEESSNLFKQKEGDTRPLCNNEQPSRCDNTCSNSICNKMEEIGVVAASWVKSPPIASLTVCFNPIAEKQITDFSAAAEDICFRLKYLADGAELQAAITQVLTEDPRSTYRRQKCSSQLYYFVVDTAHVTAWFEDSLVEILRVKPLDSNKQIS
ncbi:hypothetical protein Pmani_018654 [Petrolisthes manimaculis]|uniref:TsaA-like domain-containing protein n=1 Tax=Petrolisthes manimaculis TaxID=1843537 RepID=A0AAE1U8J9_9EUCA|nr:hypothetical protein Pmani_018654 [Petrolisthes manimaculis]